MRRVPTVAQPKAGWRRRQCSACPQWHSAQAGRSLEAMQRVPTMAQRNGSEGEGTAKAVRGNEKGEQGAERKRGTKRAMTPRTPRAGYPAPLPT